MRTLSRLRIPQPDGGVERSRGQHKARAGVGGAGPGRTRSEVGSPAGGQRPADRLVVCARSEGRAHLCSVVVRTGGEQRSGGIPFDRIHFVPMALEASEVAWRVEFADIDHAVRRAARKRVLIAPIHVERGLLVKGKFLPDGARGGVPHHRRLVDRA
eukprot:scaffold14564_cov123-Isochrysis_galbana.AAC.3